MPRLSRAIGNGMKKIRVHYGMSQRQAIKSARMMGAMVQPIRGTGELRYRFRSGRRIVTDRRRKDASKKLVAAMLDELAL
jgi:hypothetical protein